MNLRSSARQQRHDLVVKLHEAFLEDVLDLRVADLELAQRVEVDFVDRAAGRNKSDEHEAKHATKTAQSTAISHQQPSALL
jgi:hypothetical protein